VNTSAAESCPSLAECFLMCISGYQQRPDGCYVCQCVVEPEHEAEFKSGQSQQLIEAMSLC